MIQKNKTKKGFTIIEVVLVLAIAGLIFLMVFVVFPTLQRNQRDTQRKDDMSRLTTAFLNYQTNNRSKLPLDAGEVSTVTNANRGGTFSKTIDKFILQYLLVGEDTFEDPSTGDVYTLEVKSPCSPTSGCESTEVPAEGHVKIWTNAKCDGETPVYDTGVRKFAFTIDLEGAGTYCGQN